MAQTGAQPQTADPTPDPVAVVAEILKLYPCRDAYSPELDETRRREAAAAVCSAFNMTPRGV